MEKTLPLVHKFPSRTTRTESSHSFVFGNCFLNSGIRKRGAVAILPVVIPAYAATRIPVQTVMIVVPAALCLRTKSRYACGGGMLFGGGPGK